MQAMDENSRLQTLVMFGNIFNDFYFDLVPSDSYNFDIVFEG